jgi:cob(I)alamin adenosyltransferase
VSAPAAGAVPRGLLIVYTGNGKGKTTAACGVLLRSLGHGMRTATIQFLKGKWSTGERRYAEAQALDWSVMGRGFTWESGDLAMDKQAVRDAWDLAREKIVSDAFDLVILDEVNYALHYGYLSCDEVLEVMRGRPETMHVIATGRNAPQALVDAADLVTEMREIKHPYKRGIAAQKGIDF